MADARFRAGSELVNRGYYKLYWENATSGYVGVIGMRHGINIFNLVYMDGHADSISTSGTNHYVNLTLADNFSKN